MRTSKEIIEAAMHFFPDWQEAQDVDDVQDIQIATGARYGIRSLEPELMPPAEKESELTLSWRGKIWRIKWEFWIRSGSRKILCCHPTIFPYEPCRARNTLKKKTRIGEVLALILLGTGSSD
jgi:hypothetical protein